MVSIELIGNREPLSPNQMEGKGRLLLGKLNLNLIHLPVGKSDKAGRTAAKARVHQELLKLLFLALIERADGAVIILMELIALHRYLVCLYNPQDTDNLYTTHREKLQQTRQTNQQEQDCYPILDAMLHADFSVQ